MKSYNVVFEINECERFINVKAETWQEAWKKAVEWSVQNYYNNTTLPDSIKISFEEVPLGMM